MADRRRHTHENMHGEVERDHDPGLVTQESNE